MRQSLFALAAIAFLLGACTEPPQTSTPAAAAHDRQGVRGSPITRLGQGAHRAPAAAQRPRAPIGQAMQQAAEMALFDTGAKELALAAYDSGESAETAIRGLPQGAHRRRGPGAGPAVRHLGHGAGAAASTRAAPTSSSFSNDESVAQPGVWVMGIAAPPQVRRVVDYAVEPASSASPPSRRRHLRRADGAARSKATSPCAAAPWPRVETLRRNSADLATAAQRLADAAQGRGQARRAGAGGAAAAVGGAGRAGRRPASTTSRCSSSAPACGTCPASARKRCCAAPGMPRPIRPGAPTSSASSSRPTAGRRIAWRRSPTTRVSLAGQLARAEAGRRFLGRGDHQSQRLVGRRRHLPLPARRPHRARAGGDRGAGRPRLGRRAPRPTTFASQPVN